MKEMRQFEPNRNTKAVFISDGTRHRTHYHRRLLISIPRFTQGNIFGGWMRQTEWNRWLVCSSPFDYFVLKTIDPCWSISMPTWIVHRNRVRQWRFLRLENVSYLLASDKKRIQNRVVEMFWNERACVFLLNKHSSNARLDTSSIKERHAHNKQGLQLNCIGKTVDKYLPPGIDDYVRPQNTDTQTNSQRWDTYFSSLVVTSVCARVVVDLSSYSSPSSPHYPSSFVRLGGGECYRILLFFLND